MNKEILYNGSRFPDYIFKKSLSCIFIEFDFIFTDEFLMAFKFFLDSKAISEITVQNIEPKDYFFSENISVKELPLSFKKSACVIQRQNYIDIPASFQMLVETGVIHSTESEALFCLFLERGYELAILGLSDVRDIDFFAKVRIENMTGHFRMIFPEKGMPENFEKKLSENWGNILQ